MAREVTVSIVVHARVMSGDGPDGTAAEVQDAVCEFIDGQEVYVGDRGYVLDVAASDAKAGLRLSVARA